MPDLVSCLCVTEGRPAFMPWLLWNYDKQDHADRELVVVDSSPEPLELPGRADVRVVAQPPGTSVPAKRNAALDAARGDVVTWFDDDDWQHPRKLSLLVAALANGATLAGCSRSWFVDLDADRARPHSYDGGILFNSAGVRRSAADRVRFDERRRRASDTPWMQDLRRHTRGAGARLRDPLFFWLCHGGNLSNPAGRRGGTQPLDAVRSAIGAGDWGDTDHELAALRERIAAPGPRRASRASRASASPARARRPDPLAARACVVVTTFERPDGVERLLDDLEREWRGPGDLQVRVYDDASSADYSGVADRLAARGWLYRRAAANHGKHGWWRWWNQIMAELRDVDASSFLVLQDDMRLCTRFFERAFDLWHAIPDERPGALTLHKDEHRGAPGSNCWTPLRSRPAGPVLRTGWVDFPAFICTSDMWETIRWELAPIDKAWQANRMLGSGVGAQVSRRLYRNGRRMYLVRESLVAHVDRPSLMNAHARTRVPMRTAGFVDGDAALRALTRAAPYRFASLASVPERRRGLEAVVEALAPQVDGLGVYLNGYDEVPGVLDDRRVRVATSDRDGDRGDAGKFHWAGRVSGYQLVCDDDLAYPPDYVDELVAGIERHDRRAVVGFHGAVLEHEVRDYYRSRRLSHFSMPLERDQPVHVVGTGVAGYHSDAIRVAPADFPVPNMADVWLGLLGQRQRVPFVCLRRRAGWLREIDGFRAGSIYATSMAAGAAEPTRVVREHGPWQLHTRQLPIAAVRAAPVRARPAVEPGAPVKVTVRGPAHPAELWLPALDHITMAVQRSRDYYERDLLDAMRERGGDGVWVDVGAHYGNHTVFYSLECRADRVIAIEPNPAAFAGLCDNLDANRLGPERVTPMNVAVHSSWRRVQAVELPWKRGAGTRAVTNTGRCSVEPADDDLPEAVPGLPLDEALADAGRVAVIKVDAQGHTVDALSTGRQTIARDRPLVAVEAADDAAFATVKGLLDPLGYSPVGRYCWTATWLWQPA